MALIGEAALGGDGRERPLGIAQQFTGGAHLEAMLVISRSSFLDLAEDTGQVHGMNSRFAGQVAHAEAVPESVMQPILDPAKPARDGLFRGLLFGRSQGGNRSQHFEDVGLKHQWVRGLRLEPGVQAQAGP